MKLEPSSNNPEGQEIVAPVPTERRLLNRYTRKPGLTLWQIDLNTNEITAAVFKKSYVNSDGEVHHEMNYSQNYFYVEALNKKNAKRKYIRRGLALRHLAAKAKAQVNPTPPAQPDL